jgi:hypothetical protein
MRREESEYWLNLPFKLNNRMMDHFNSLYKTKKALPEQFNIGSLVRWVVLLVKTKQSCVCMLQYYDTSSSTMFIDPVEGAKAAQYVIAIIPIQKAYVGLFFIAIRVVIPGVSLEHNLFGHLQGLAR